MGEDGGEDGDGNFRTGFAEGAKQGDGVGIRQDVCAENRMGRGCGNAEQGGCAGVLGGDAVSEVLDGFGDAVRFTGFAGDQQDVHRGIKKERDGKSTKMDF